MTASTPRRSGSACQSSSASPTRAAASTASRSSHEPGKRTTPNRMPPTIAVLPDLVVLDQRVGEQRLAHLGQAVGVVHLELDQPPDPHVADALEPQGGQGALHRLALGIEDPGLGADEDE